MHGNQSFSLENSENRQKNITIAELYSSIGGIIPQKSEHLGSPQSDGQYLKLAL